MGDTKSNMVKAMYSEAQGDYKIQVAAVIFICAYLYKWYHL